MSICVEVTRRAHSRAQPVGNPSPLEAEHDCPAGAREQEYAPPLAWVTGRAHDKLGCSVRILIRYAVKSLSQIAAA